MKAKLLLAIGCAACLWGCDDTTVGIGGIVSDYDEITAASDSLKVMTRTISIDEAYAEGDKYKGIYSRTSNACLGTYTDPTFGSFKTDFITQLNCPEGFRFDETMDSISESQLVLYYPKFFGDSLAPMTLNVRLLRDDFDITDDGKDSEIYYTSYDPLKFSEERIIGTKDYTATDLTVSDSIKNTPNYADNISIPLDHLKDNAGNEFNLSQYLFDKYKEDPTYFDDAQRFIDNVIRGFYVEAAGGDGSILYINDIWLISKLRCYIKSKDGKRDSAVYIRNIFPATREVFMSTRFNNDKETFNKLISEKKHTYLKTPAGLCTEIDLFYNQEEFDKFLKMKKDSTSLERINAADIIFKKYKNSGEEESFKMGIPQTLLLVRKGEVKDFFEQNKVIDNKTSFLGQYDEKINGYRFSSLHRLFNSIYKEIDANGGKYEDPASPESNQFKFLLVPVKVEKDSQGKVINVTHDLEINSARLLGGEEGEKNRMNIIYTNRLK